MLVAIYGSSDVQVHIVLVQARWFPCRVERTAPMAHFATLARSRLAREPPDQPVVYLRMPARIKPDDPAICVFYSGAGPFGISC